MNHPVNISTNDKTANIISLPNGVDTGALIINQANADLFYTKQRSYIGEGKPESYLWLSSPICCAVVEESQRPHNTDRTRGRDRY